MNFSVEQFHGVPCGGHLQTKRSGSLSSQVYRRATELDYRDGRVLDVQDFVEMVIALPHHQRITLFALDHRTGQTGYLKVQIN
jgi:hypothetical protein